MGFLNWWWEGNMCLFFIRSNDVVGFRIKFVCFVFVESGVLLVMWSNFCEVKLIGGFEMFLLSFVVDKFVILLVLLKVVGIEVLLLF